VIFSASATHALRALAHLAATGGPDATLGRVLATDVGVPSPYLAKVLGTLARSGLVIATRGVRGGYRLARPAHEITLREIVEPFEGKRVDPGCLLRPDEACWADGPCPAHEAWSGVKTAYLSFLEKTTLADIQGGVPGGDDGRRPKPTRRPRDARSTTNRRRTR
jgi:Rrf2 family protein